MVIESLRCNSCGSHEIDIQPHSRIGKCKSCGSVVILPDLENHEILGLLDQAYIFRTSLKFADAFNTYSFIIEKCPTELAAYEGILLAKYGIIYEFSEQEDKWVATSRVYNPKCIFDDKFYQYFVENCVDEEEKAAFVEKAEEIDKLQKAYAYQLKNEKDYDVFISFKSKVNGKSTEDARIARELYDELTDRLGLRVFMSDVTLKGRIVEEFEPIIYKALHSSKVFILVGTSKENIEAPWVKNEWIRFIDRINCNEDVDRRSFIPVFKNMNPDDMPCIGNRQVQCVDASDLLYYKNISDYISELLGLKKNKEEEELQRQKEREEFERQLASLKAVEAEITKGSSGSLQDDYNLLIRKGFRFLETGNPEKASGFFEQAIGVVDQCGEAYLGQLLVSRKLLSIKDAKELDDVSFFETDLFKNAKKFASSEFLKTIIDIEHAILNNNHKRIYEFYKKQIETSESPKDLHKVICLLSELINKSLESNKINEAKIDLFNDEIELTYKGCLKLGELLLNQTLMPEDMFKIDYALDMLSDPEISSHCNVSQLVKRLNDKKTELIKQYDTWCVNQLMPNELIKVNPSFDIQFENFKDVICKYKENKIIFDSFPTKDEYVAGEYERIQKELFESIENNAEQFFESVPNDIEIMINVSKAFIPFVEIDSIKEELATLNQRIRLIKKQQSSKGKLHGLFAFLAVIGTLGLLVGLTFLLLGLL